MDMRGSALATEMACMQMPELLVLNVTSPSKNDT